MGGAADPSPCRCVASGCAAAAGEVTGGVTPPGIGGGGRIPTNATPRRLTDWKPLRSSSDPIPLPATKCTAARGKLLVADASTKKFLTLAGQRQRDLDGACILFRSPVSGLTGVVFGDSGGRLICPALGHLCNAMLAAIFISNVFETIVIGFGWTYFTQIN